MKGSVTQWRWGIQARIGLDIESGEPIRQAWVFPIKTQDSTALLGLLALPHSSLVLQFAKDFGQVQAVPAEETELDLSTRTLFAAQCAPDEIIQITESFMAVASHKKRYAANMSGKIWRSFCPVLPYINTHIVSNSLSRTFSTSQLPGQTRHTTCQVL